MKKLGKTEREYDKIVSVFCSCQVTVRPPKYCKLPPGEKTVAPPVRVDENLFEKECCHDAVDPNVLNDELKLVPWLKLMRE